MPENINDGYKDKPRHMVESSDSPESVIDMLSGPGQELREQLQERLGNLKNILNTLESKTQDIPTENEIHLSLSHVERSIMIIKEISNDLREIRHNNQEPDIHRAVIEVQRKIVGTYDTVVDKLSR